MERGELRRKTEFISEYRTNGSRIVYKDMATFEFCIGVVQQQPFLKLILLKLKNGAFLLKLMYCMDTMQRESRQA